MRAKKAILLACLFLLSSCPPPVTTVTTTDTSTGTRYHIESEGVKDHGIEQIFLDFGEEFVSLSLVFKDLELAGGISYITENVGLTIGSNVWEEGVLISASFDTDKIFVSGDQFVVIRGLKTHAMGAIFIGKINGVEYKLFMGEGYIYLFFPIEFDGSWGNVYYVLRTEKNAIGYIELDSAPETSGIKIVLDLVNILNPK